MEMKEMSGWQSPDARCQKRLDVEPGYAPLDVGHAPSEFSSGHKQVAASSQELRATGRALSAKSSASSHASSDHAPSSHAPTRHGHTSASLRRQRTLHSDTSATSGRHSRGDSVKPPPSGGRKNVQRSNTISETDSLSSKQKADVTRKRWRLISAHSAELPSLNHNAVSALRASSEVPPPSPPALLLQRVRVHLRQHLLSNADSDVMADHRQRAVGKFEKQTKEVKSNMNSFRRCSSRNSTQRDTPTSVAGVVEDTPSGTSEAPPTGTPSNHLDPNMYNYKRSAFRRRSISDDTYNRPTLNALLSAARQTNAANTDESDDGVVCSAVDLLAIVRQNRGGSSGKRSTSTSATPTSATPTAAATPTSASNTSCNVSRQSSTGADINHIRHLTNLSATSSVHALDPGQPSPVHSLVSHSCQISPNSREVMHGKFSYDTSSTKQEQGEQTTSSIADIVYDEHGQTWDVYGADYDPDVLGSAIENHLERCIVQSGPTRRSEVMLQMNSKPRYNKTLARFTECFFPQRTRLSGL